MLESVKQAKIGTIVPVYKEINEEINALEYFAKLSDYGRKKNSVLFEYDGKSLGSANPCLIVIGKGNDFEITALNNVGKRFLNFIKKDFKFCDKAVYGKGRIYGTLMPAKKDVSEEERLKLKTHFDIIRAIAFKFNPAAKLLPCGLFGIISSNFASQTEDLPNNNEDLLKDPDYAIYFLDNMFMVDHEEKKTYLVSNALITDKHNDKTYNECSKTIKNYEKIISKKVPKAKKFKKKKLELMYDASKDELLKIMKDLKKQIFDGNILYTTPSRAAIVNYNAEPLDIYAKYAQLKNANSACMFYVNDGYGISIGSGANANLNVNNEEKTVELRISTTAKPRGVVKEGAEKDLDSKYEALLRVDENEIAYHAMLVDALRNDVAKISQTGTRYVDKLFIVDKQNELQNLVSSVKGTLKKDLDALHAYMVTVNPSLIDGFPKIKSMQLLRQAEKTKRCFNHGSVVFIAPDGDLHSMAAEPIRIKKDKAYIRASSRVFCNSDEENEFNIANKKETKLLDIIKSLGGLK